MRRISLSFLVFLTGIAAVLAGIIMVPMGAHHVFHASGGAIYYGIVLGLICGGILTFVIAWGFMAGKGEP